MRHRSMLLSVLFSTMVFHGLAHGKIRMPNSLSDHAVLQRGQPIHIWGWSSPNAHIVAALHNQIVPTDADEIGTWSLCFQPEEAGGPYTLTLTGDGSAITIGDVLLGDVWVASGQSNMEMPLGGFPSGPSVKNQDAEVAAATHPELRLLRLEKVSSDVPLSDTSSVWTLCVPEVASKFSAVAYFFGREIAAREQVPIGLVQSAWGGTPADSWVSMDTLSSHPDLLPAFASRARFAEDQVNIELKIAAEKREDEAANAAGKPLPKHPYRPVAASWMPAGLYNAMIAPLAPMTIKGFLWYQGETNAGHDRAPYYGRLLGGLIGDWRSRFQQGALPFLYVQISSFEVPGGDWGLVRDQQRRALDVANTGMAVSLDVGNAGNVHPPDKQTVGGRLALAARGLVYSEGVTYIGPLYRRTSTELTRDGLRALRVWFDHAEGLNFPSGRVQGFEVAAADHHFVAAEAVIQGKTVLVSSKSLRHPIFVRYGWNSVVSESLYNGAGLPTSTFTSESEPFN